MSNLRQVGIAITTYAGTGRSDSVRAEGATIYEPGKLLSSTGSPTSLLSLQTGALVGLGLLLAAHLANQPKVLFCPGAKRWTPRPSWPAWACQAQAATTIVTPATPGCSIDPNVADTLVAPRLDSLGDNRDGRLVRALALDTQFLSPPDLAAFNVTPRTHHHLRWVNTLHADASVVARKNSDGRLTVDLREYGDIHDAFSRILRVFEQADAAF
jgi:hypothetical protein